MANHYVHVGFGNIINGEKIVAVVSTEAQPTRRAIKEAKENGKFIDATSGRKARAAVIMDSYHVIAVSVSPETIGTRMKTDGDEL